MKVLIIGTGLIGGSFALSLKRGGNYRVGGWDSNADHLAGALDAGIVQESFSSIVEAIAWAEAIILSVPISAIQQLLPQVLDQLQPHQFVIDFGSTKGSICSLVKEHPLRNRFLAAHPIAGTEYSGPSAAFTELYDGKVMIVCEVGATDVEVADAFTQMCALSSMELVFMDAEEHDRHLAYISHLSHVVAFGLSHVVLQKEKDGHVILELAGSGLASTVRLAKSSPEMWAPIFLDNKQHILDGIDELQQRLQSLRDLVATGDEEAILQFLKEGRNIRKILE